MTTIRIQEQLHGPNNTNAVISFDNGPQYSVTVTDPFSGEEEELLEWYFEDHLRFPFLDQVKAQQVAASIKTYGKRLSQQIVADPDARFAYLDARRQGLNTLQFEIAGSPKFHALHWEALKDPDLPRPLALQAVIVRKNMARQAVPAGMQLSPTINLLVVTARPFGKGDVSYRTISQPLVEILHRTELPVKIDILRPGTYKALATHLRSVSDQRGVGSYLVIHFDLHGAVLEYKVLQKGQA